MKKLILTFALLLFTNSAYAQAVGSGAWLFVPKIGSGWYPILAGQEANTGPWRADTSTLPISVKGWSGQPIAKANCPVTITTDGCYLIKVNEDFSKVGPTALSHWTKPAPTAVSNTLAAKGIDVQKYPALPLPNVVHGWLNRYHLFDFSSLTQKQVDDWLKQHKIYGAWEWMQPVSAWAGACAPCDNFNRTASNPISGSWTYGNVYATSDYPQIVTPSGNTALGGVGIVNGLGIAYFTGFSWANDQESQITLTTFTDPAPGSFHVLAGPTVRMDGNMGFDTAHFYGVLAAGSTSYVEIDSYNPYPTSIITLASQPVTFAAGDTIKLRVVGTTLTAYQNGVSVATASTDGTSSSGHPGMWLNDNTSDTLGANLLVDNFTAADVGGAAVVRHRVLNQ